MGSGSNEGIEVGQNEARHVCKKKGKVIPVTGSGGP
jgi:hypothetical protein